MCVINLSKDNLYEMKSLVYFICQNTSLLALLKCQPDVQIDNKCFAICHTFTVFFNYLFTLLCELYLSLDVGFQFPVCQYVFG